MKSEYYFLINLLLLIVISYLCFLLIRQLTNSQFTGVFSGLIYFLMIPTQQNFIWLSNIQHLSAHFFILLFLLLSCNDRFLFDIHHVKRRSLILILVFMLGMYCNLGMVAVIPSLIAYIVLFQGISGLNRPKLALILVLSSWSIFFWLRVRDHIDPAYAAHFTPAQFMDTFFFYATGMGGRKVRFLAIWGSCLALMCLTLLVCLLNRDRRGVFLLLLAGAFYMPFAFLVYTRHLNYLALPMLFGTGSVIYVAKRYLKAPALVYALVLSHIFFSTRMIKGLYDQPALGSHQRSFIVCLNRLDLKDHKRVCLKRAEPPWPNMTGEPHWDASYFWRTLGDGDALNVCGDVRADYLPPDGISPSNLPTIEVDDHLNILRVTLPRKIGTSSCEVK